MSVSVADQGEYYKGYRGYSGVPYTLEDQKSNSRRLVGVTPFFPSLCLSFIFFLSFSLS